MTIKHIAQYTLRTVYLSLTMGFISYSSAGQPGFSATQYSPHFAKDVKSLGHYSRQPSVAQGNNIKPEQSSSKKSKTHEQRIASFLYRTIDNPDRVLNQVAGSAILYGLDSVGFGDSVREGLTFIKENTRYTFGNCGHVKLKTSRITAGSCLMEGGSVQLQSSYNFDSLQLQFQWSI